MSINKVSIVKDSVNIFGNRLTTYEIETYRYIWAEVLTHKMLSKNAQSSRAVPVNSVLSINQSIPVEPIVWGKNKAGMSATESLVGFRMFCSKGVWKAAAKFSFLASKTLSKLGLHKQWSNRLTEPYSRIKVVISGTEWDNFEWLRDDPEAAQPEIVDLARKIKELKAESIPFLLRPGEAHVPYVTTIRQDEEGDLQYFDVNGEVITLSRALKISASCLAQISYRKLDCTLEKAMRVYKQLFDGTKPHYSPTEHAGIAIGKAGLEVGDIFDPSNWERGISHIDKEGKFWSANFKGFIQHRKLLELEN